MDKQDFLEEKKHRETKKSYKNNLDYLNEFVMALSKENESKNKILIINSFLHQKINYNDIGLCIIDKNNDSAYFLALKNNQIYDLDINNKELCYTIKKQINQSMYKPFNIKNIINANELIKISPSCRNLLFCNLIDNEEYNTVLIFFADDDYVFQDDELSLLESLCPYISLVFNDYILDQIIKDNKEEQERYAKELELINTKLHSMPCLDGLTGIPNRKHFNTVSLYIYRKAIEMKKPLCFLMLDIDNFKRYNLKYGNDLGNKAIRQIAKALHNTVKEFQFFINYEALFSRCSGDLFALMFMHENVELLEEICKKLIEKVESLNIEYAHAETGILSISIGASYSRYYEDYNIKSFCKFTKTQLYIAKMMGEGSYIINEFKLETEEEKQ